MNRINKSWFLLLAITFLLSCQDKTVDGQLTAGPGEQVKLPNGLILTIQSIQDSRCPSDAVCIRAGEALVGIALSADQTTQKDTLCVGTDCKAAYIQKQANGTYTIGGRSLTVELLNVTPYPSRDVKSQKAVLRVN